MLPFTSFELSLMCQSKQLLQHQSEKERRIL